MDLRLLKKCLFTAHGVGPWYWRHLMNCEKGSQSRFSGLKMQFPEPLLRSSRVRRTLIGSGRSSSSPQQKMRQSATFSFLVWGQSRSLFFGGGEREWRAIGSCLIGRRRKKRDGDFSVPCLSSHCSCNIWSIGVIFLRSWSLILPALLWTVFSRFGELLLRWMFFIFKLEGKFPTKLDKA